VDRQTRFSVPRRGVWDLILELCTRTLSGRRGVRCKVGGNRGEAARSLSPVRTAARPRDRPKGPRRLLRSRRWGLACGGLPSCLGAGRVLLCPCVPDPGVIAIGWSCADASPQHPSSPGPVTRGAVQAGGLDVQDRQAGGSPVLDAGGTTHRRTSSSAPRTRSRNRPAREVTVPRWPRAVFRAEARL
jgi:hypothetical protein